LAFVFVLQPCSGEPRRDSVYRTRRGRAPPSTQGETAMYRVGEIQTIDRGSDFYGVGFSILNRNGAPVVTFGYLDGGDAVKAHALVEKAIAEAKFVAPAA
jgi:hypothetical protein